MTKRGGPAMSDIVTAKLTRDGLDEIASNTNERLKSYKAMLMVCTSTGCASAKSFDIKDKLTAEIKARGLEKDFLVVATGCIGFCSVGPVMVVQPQGVFYQKIGPRDVAEIIDSHLIGGKVVERLLYRDPASGQIYEKIDEIPFFTAQQPVVLRNRGLIDPEKIEHYIARGGYKAIAKAIEMPPDVVVEQVIASGIRGRGGGGFPTGIKWQSCKKAMAKRNEIGYVVCNADGYIIETDPHSVIEGMLIGAYAVGAEEGFVYTRKEYPLALARLEKAVSQARQYGLLGENILDSEFTFDIAIHRDAGAFVCGESSALMASMSGRAGEPRAKYLHSVEYGYRDKPTVLNNVETWANIPAIIEKGAKWFASMGTGDVSNSPWSGSSGTKVFYLIGAVTNTGLVEVPMGISIRKLVFEIGGGIPGGRKFKAIQTGGPSGGCIPESLLDMPIDFDSLSKAGSMMGSGGMIVMDEKTCMVDVARYSLKFLVDESCGKCTPCREGLFALSNTLTNICQGKGKPGDIEFLEELSQTISDTSLCQLGVTATNPVTSTLRYFKDEYEKHIHDKKCPAGVCKNLIKYHINDNCTGCAACKKHCPTEAISGQAKELHAIDPDKCVKCGVCYEVCKFDAVEVI